MSLILAWVLFPLVLAAVSAGWGAVVELGSGSEVKGVLLIPLGAAAVIIVALLMTEVRFIAQATVPLIALVALAGLYLLRSRRPQLWPLLAAVGVLVAYGAAVIFSGEATFTGIIKLDDTSTWLDVVDHAWTHLHETGGIPTSTWSITFETDVGPTYPLGAFMLLAVGHTLTGIDPAWTIDPYEACCGAGIALCIYALVEPLIASPRLRGLVAFLAAQPALLYGYMLWGGIKEITSAFLLALGAVLAAQVLVKRPENPRGLLPLAVAASGLIAVLSVGAAAWVIPAMLVLIVVWVRRDWAAKRMALVRDLGVLAGMTAVLALPVWITVSKFLGERANGLFSSGTHTPEESLGNLIQPLSGWQLAGIWPVGDFRQRVATFPSALFIALVLIAAAATIFLTLRRRQFGVIMYVGVALIGCAIFWIIGASPWATGKALAISSPALLAAALIGGGMLWSQWGSRRLLGLAGVAVVVAIGGGVAWSNVLAYHDTSLAPRQRMAELQHIGGLLAGKGPTFINQYEVYADRHFLHEGAPVEPAEFRPVTLPLRSGIALTKSAEADLDSFPLSTLEPYRSIVTPVSPAESRPPSTYQLIWKGRFYALWQRPAVPTMQILEHVPLGESKTRPYCGAAENGGALQLCSANPVAVPPCSQILGLGRQAADDHAQLIAYQRAAPIVLRADESTWPGLWAHEMAGRVLIPTTPGAVVYQVSVTSTQNYELWLDGDFSRGFEVSVDGRYVGRVKDELSGFSLYDSVANLPLTAGSHTIELTYPKADLTAGSGDTELTSLSAIALEPQSPPSELITVSAAQARTLCGRSLDWIEIVAPLA